MSHAQCTWRDRILLPPLHSTLSFLDPSHGSIHCNPHRGGQFGRLAKQSPITGYEPNDPVEVGSTEVTTTGWLRGSQALSFLRFGPLFSLRLGIQDFSFFLGESSYGEGEPKTDNQFFNFGPLLLNVATRCKICDKTAGFSTLHTDAHQ